MVVFWIIQFKGLFSLCIINLPKTTWCFIIRSNSYPVQICKSTHTQFSSATLCHLSLDSLQNTFKAIMNVLWYVINHKAKNRSTGVLWWPVTSHPSPLIPCHLPGVTYYLIKVADRREKTIKVYVYVTYVYHWGINWIFDVDELRPTRGGYIFF